MSTVSHEEFVDQLRAVLRNSSSDDPQPTLARIASFTRRAVGADAAGFSVLAPDGRLLTVGESDRLVITTDAMQDQLREGPGIDLTSATCSGTTDSRDLLTERRWPRWAPLAAHLGFRSLLSVIVPAGDLGQSALFTVYGKQVRQFVGTDVTTIRLVAAPARAALGSVQRESRPTGLPT
ncbi:hypothetical protein [Microlunatus soli]|uniref:GAF domain-containing protein n=1 Tax=Microlunatus soli TaxID=630515 RepID=A0A1H1N2Y8_9ACTN|nr:hypothetical protein [Microlunatus soli]SDR93248.1 hypothetical protein SAMN04489812_0355 [Microlunatus soli]